MRTRWIPWVVAVAASALAAVACNSITGLDDYEKVDCVGACGDADLPDVLPEGAPDVLGDTTSDVVDDVRDAGSDGEAGLDADLDGEAGDAPDDIVIDVTYDASETGAVDRRLRWARWQMPHEYIPDLPDGSTSPGPKLSEGYDTDASVEYFVDRVTDIRWTYTHPTALTLGEAVTHCTGLSVAGYSKVRLPTRIELVSLLEPSQEPPYSTALPEAEPGMYWTLSDAPARNSDAGLGYWVVDFSNGEVRVENVSDNTKGYVRCVSESL